MKLIKKLTQLKSSDLSKIREKLHKKQNGICPILKKEFPIENMVVDHLHKKHAKLLNLPNSGCVRGVIHRQANSFEGKIANLLVRLGLHKFDLTLPELLRNTADYLEQECYPYIHPTEKKKTKKLSKQSFNKLSKLYKEKYPNRKKLEYPKSKKITKTLTKIYKDFNIEPKFLKGK